MGNSVTFEIQSKIIEVFNVLKSLGSECENIEKVYFSAGVSTYITGLASGTTAATVESKLTKQEMIDGITLCQQLKNFLSNQAVATSDYGSTLQNLIYADATGATGVPASAEGIGNRIKQIASDMNLVHKKAKEIEKIYFTNEIHLLGAMTSSRVVFGADVTVNELVSAITTLQQIKGMIENQAVATGAYLDNVLLWERFLN